MIPFFILCGLYALLRLPLPGALLFHALRHALLHGADHHPDAFLYGLSALRVGLVLLGAAALILGWYFVAGDAVVIVLALRSLLRADQGH
jgi:hypothetical protein